MRDLGPQVRSVPAQGETAGFKTPGGRTFTCPWNSQAANVVGAASKIRVSQEGGVGPDHTQPFRLPEGPGFLP